MYLSHCKTNLDALRQVTSQLESELNLLQGKVDGIIPKPKKYLEYPPASNYKVGSSSLEGSVSYLFVFRNGYGQVIEPTMECLSVRKQQIFNILDEYAADCEPITIQNEEILQHNKLVEDKIHSIMQELGVPKVYSTYEFKTSRSSKRTETKHTSGYVADIQRLLGYKPSPKVNVVATKKAVEEFFNTKQKELAEKQRLAELEQKKKTQMHELALLRAKYTPDDAESDKSDILEVILSKDKYLRLAYYLEMNRGDWSNGYDYAETGISGFTPETDEDFRIVETLRQTISDSYPVDGRVFRHSWPTYGDLYAKVSDQMLLNDLEKIELHFN